MQHQAARDKEEEVSVHTSPYAQCVSHSPTLSYLSSFHYHHQYHPHPFSPLKRSLPG